MIDASDLELFRYADDPETALQILQGVLPREQSQTTPAFAKSVATASTIAPSTESASGGK